jgi:hypothetical protein
VLICRLVSFDHAWQTNSEGREQWDRDLPPNHAAEADLRHRRILETSLHDILGNAWGDVNQEADRLRQFISETVDARIAAKPGNPQIDPHGHIIPFPRWMIRCPM